MEGAVHVSFELNKRRVYYTHMWEGQGGECSCVGGAGWEYHYHYY